MSLFFGILIFSQDIWGNVCFVTEINLNKSLLSSEQNNLKKKSETRFCRRKAAEDNNAKIKVFPNIACSFLLVKASAFLQISFPRNLLFRYVLRTSVFLNSKFLKISKKRTHIALFIKQFVSLTEQDLGN